MWPNPQKTTDLVTFTEEILNGKLHFLCSVFSGKVLSKKSVQTTCKKSCISVILYLESEFPERQIAAD